MLAAKQLDPRGEALFGQFNRNAVVRALAPFGDDACSVKTDILSEGDFVDERFI
jgi:hypothetical protein